MTPCWNLTRWGVLQAHHRCAVRTQRKICLAQRLYSTEPFPATDQPSKSLSENEFLDFVLGSYENPRPTQNESTSGKPGLGSPSSARELKKHDEVTDGHPLDSPGQGKRKGRKRRLSAGNNNRSLSIQKAERSLVGYVRTSTIPVPSTVDQPARIRWLNLRHRSRPSADVSTAWTVNYARLANKYDSAPGVSPEPFLDTELDERASQWAEELLSTIDSHAPELVGVLDIGQFQHRFGERGRGVWREVMLWLLANQRDRAVDFLLATHVGPFYPPMNWVADSLYLLALHYTSVDTENRTEMVSKLINAFRLLSVRSSSGEHMDMQNGFVRRLLPLCSQNEVEALYSTLKFNQVQVHARTLHHLSRYFAKHDRLELGIEALLEARALGSNVNGYMFRSNCTTLLRAAMRHPGGQRLGLKLVDNLLKMGVYLDKQLRGIVMLNAVDSGDLGTAMTVYESMIASGIRPDPQTYGILLKGCRTNLDDTATLTGIIDRAIKDSDVRQNPILSTQILHCLCLHHTKYKNGFATIKEAYSQLFRKTPLEKLGIDMSTEHVPVNDGDGSLMPSGYDIAIMLTAYLRDASILEAKRLYDAWRRLVLSGDEFFVLLASKPFLPNTFIYKFASNKTSLLEATRVVKDMQMPLALCDGAKQSAPDAYTWSMLVHGFTKFNEPRHAERVLAKMQELGYRPNDVTWNTLLTGYASNQDIEGTLDTLRRLEESDMAYNEWTYRGLSRLSERNRMKVKSEMDRRKYVRRIDFTTDLKVGMTQKLAELGLNAES